MSIGSSSEARNPVVLRLGVTPGQTFRQVVEQTQLVGAFCDPSYFSYDLRGLIFHVRYHIKKS
jgi:hypothetical protein